MAKFMWSSMLLFLFVLLAPVLVDADRDVAVTEVTEVESAVSNSDDETQVESSESDEVNSEAPPRRLFQPTASWQTIEEDMGIPRGIHVRMNLQTGKKEGKLLDPADVGEKESGESTVDVEVPRDLRQGIVNTKRMAFTQEQLAARMAAEQEEGDSKQQPPDQRPAISYEDDTPPLGANPSPEEIARKFAEARKKVRHMQPRADIEVMQLLVGILKNSSAAESQQLSALQELEFFVHQIDNARDLEAIGGMEPVLKTLEHSNEEFRSLGLLTLGSAMQGNPPVQKTVLKYDVLPRILLLLRPESNEPVGVRRRALFALSSLVRSHVEGQQALWSLGGLDVLKGLCSQSSPHHVPALCVKAVTLIYDLVVEETSAVEASVDHQHLLPQLEASGWCDSVAGLLSSQDGDVLEKGVAALQVFVPACGNALSQQSHVLQQLSTLQHHWQSQSSSSDDEQDQYFASMHDMVTNLKLQLSRCALHSNCSIAIPSTSAPSESVEGHTEL